MHLMKNQQKVSEIETCVVEKDERAYKMQQKYRAGAGTELGAPAILVRSYSTELLSLISTAHIALTSTPNS